MKLSKTTWIKIGSGLGVLLLVYLFGAFYYQSHYVANTRIGNISIAHLSKKKATDVFKTGVDDYFVELTEKDRSLGGIHLNQLEPEIDIEETLQTLLQEQSAFAWPVYFFQKRVMDEKVLEKIDLNNHVVNLLRQQLGLASNDRTVAEDAKIIQSETDGYLIQPEVYGQEISTETLEKALKQSLFQDEAVVAVENAYIQPKVLKGDKVLTEKMEKLDRIQNTVITLTFSGHEIVIPKGKIAEWLYLSENGEPLIDTELVKEYIKGINYEYASAFLPRQFQSTYQGEVTVQAGTYGWYLNVHDEAEAIASDLLAAHSVTREPSIGGSGYDLDNEVGYSYVEVDLSNQMMWIYLDGEIALSTPIVSGRSGAETVPGAYQVWEKAAGISLRGTDPFSGTDYSQPVDYWIAFDDNAQGIHDANWQSAFGGSVHYASGSLGCINTPPSVMGTVFEIVQYGMPVIIYY